jgi:hypothetical protein
MNRFFNILKSKTVWGSIIAAGGYLINQPKIGVVEIITAAGVVLAGIGVKDGQVKTEQAALGLRRPGPR